MNKIDRNYIRWIRYAFQWALFFFIIYAGVQFYFFVEHFLSEDAHLPPPVGRPPLIEGFLPIGALMGIKLLLRHGILMPVHPSAVVIMFSAIVVSVVLKKGFCGYVCPVGALSELTYKIGKRIFGRNINVPKLIDYPLRSIKYILFALFFFVIFIQMTSGVIAAFLGGSYWRAADVKMLYFFTEMTPLTIYVLLGLFVLSLPVRNFWCRYLCPYGALLGLLSYMSPVKIRRDADKCINCSQCAKNCPQYLPVDVSEKITSPECTGCLTCVSVCPAAGALEAGFSSGKRKLNPVVYMAAVALVFFGIIWGAMLTNNWQTILTYDDYREIIPKAAMIEHP